jgi:ribonuclease PH
VRITRGYTIHAEGSVLVEFGHTRVLCTASVEDKVPPHKRGSGEGWVTAEYGMLPRATHTRGDREAATRQAERAHAGNPAPDRPLAARVFDLKKLGERTITSTATCCRPTAAPARPPSPAPSWPPRRGEPAAGHRQAERRPIIDHVAAISVGIVQGTPLLDLEYTEDSACDTDMNVVMTGAGGFVEVQGTAEGAPSRAPRWTRCWRWPKKASANWSSFSAPHWHAQTVEG